MGQNYQRLNRAQTRQGEQNRRRFVCGSVIKTICHAELDSASYFT